MIILFTDAELRYLAEHPLGRLATIDPDGNPQLTPVTFRVNPDSGTIDIGGPVFTRSRKFRNAKANPRVAFVVDGHSVAPNEYGQTGQGIEIRGRAEIVTLDPPLMAFFDAESLRIRPRRIVAWNIEGAGYNARDAT
ncbi:PPOX class F420-dependent oxidoreductase [Nonomuraea sp. NPDC048826]|uniref:PPOX class F420-dependent oxidoreductase n=1 Tax=Nonomuraea sp. NPDC048826 TaxID=3364347 RepID=UPI00371964D2